MKPEIKQKWISALRSGEYKQGSWGLKVREKDEHTYCCLGVLCDIAIKEGVDSWSDKEHVVKAIDEVPTLMGYGLKNDVCAQVLPRYIAEWAGLDSVNPSIKKDEIEDKLSYFNDYAKLDFSQIANLIEEQL